MIGPFHGWADLLLRGVYLPLMFSWTSWHLWRGVRDLFRDLHADWRDDA